MTVQRQPGESLVDFTARLRASKAAPPQRTFDDDLIPDPGPQVRPPEEYEIDTVLDRVDIVDAYRRWCGKMEPDTKGKRESIMVSCPNPAHPDKNPSAWMNLDKGDGGVGTCALCGGFDKYDIAAWHFGFDVPGYKTKDFRELRHRMAEGLGYRVMVKGKDEWLEKIQPTTTPTPTTPEPPALKLVPEPSDDFLEAPSFDWRELPAITPDTFLHQWLTTTSQSFEPEEFYFWLGLLGLAAAVGNNVTLGEDRPVRPNLMVCLIGTTGSGKSLSISLFEEMMRRALPFNAQTGGGVRMIASPGSGEALIDQFAVSHLDPSSGVRTDVPVNGLYRENEFAALAKRTGRAGNTMREVLMDFYDRRTPVTSTSRGAGSVVAKDHFMQMITSTQPAAIGRLMTDGDAAAGYLNRWVFGFGKPKRRPPRSNLRLDTSAAANLLQDVRAWGARGREVKFYDDPAGFAWDEFHDRELEPITHDQEAWMAARLPLLAKKIITLFAVNQKLTTVTIEHIESLKMMWPYLLKCYGIVGREVGTTELDACAAAIEKYMRERPEENVTLRTLSKQSGARRFTNEQIKKSMDYLIWANFVEEVAKTRTERTTYYRYIPSNVPPLASVKTIN